MSVSSDNRNRRSLQPIPDSDALVIRARDNPRQFMMELNLSDVVNVAFHSSHALLLFVVPDSDLRVISSRAEERLAGVEVHRSYRAIVLLKLFD